MVMVRKDFIDLMTVNNLTAYNDDPDFGESELYVGGSVSDGDIIVKCSAGYIIDEIVYRDDYGYDENYVISDGGTSATCKDIENFQNVTRVSVRQLTPNVQGVNQVYELDSQGVSVISSKQFDFFTGQTNLKFGDYLLGLIKLPFAIPNDVISNDNVAVKLGDFDTGVTGKLINAEKLEIDLGSIKTPLKFNNSLDFTNVTCVLYLPFCEPINIEHDFVIGETISIQYIVNLYNGEMVVNISSSKNNEVIITKNIDLNIDVPFANVQNRPPKNDSRDIRLGVDNGVRTAHIVIMRNDVILPNGTFTIPIIDEKPLQDETGFLKIDEIELQCLATDSELAKIKTLLNTGVFIHD